MPDVKSVISIADEFSGPLLRLSATALESGNAVDTLNEAVNIGKEYLADYVDELKYSASSIQKGITNQLVPSVQGLIGDLSDVGSLFTDAFGANDIASSLKEMTMLAFDGSSAFDALFDSVLQQGELIGEFTDDVSNRIGGIVSDIKEGVIPSVVQAKDSFKGLASSTKAMFEDMNSETVNEFAMALLETVVASKNAATGIASVGFQIMSTISFIRNFKLRLINSISMGAFNNLKAAYIKTFNNVRDAIDRSLDDISMTDRLNALYGEAGGVAKERAYKLANELGESARMVTELSAKAAYEGIGTDHFERMMKLADKVGKLSGESTDNVANSLIDNIKNGQDASSLARMFGGGQMMERQLRHSGYERALHRGDLDEALKIAEKIAEQAGLTDERYEKATDSLSNNYKRIQNVTENFKQRISEIYSQSFAPAVKKVREFLESEKFKKIQSIIEVIVKKVGEFVNSTVEMMIDNIHWLGIFLGIGVASKTMLIIKLISKIIGFSGPIRKFLGFAFRMVGGILGKIVSIVAQKGVLAAMRLAGPWLAVGAAVTGIVYGIYKLSGTTKSFTDWIKEKFQTASRILAAGYRVLQNVFANVFIFFDHIGDYIMNLPSLAKAAFEDILDELETLRKKIKGEDLRPRIYIDKSELDSMSEEAKKALGKIYEETSYGSAGSNSFSAFPGGGHGASTKYFYYGKEEVKKSKTDELIEKIQANQIQYLNVWEGADKALEEGWGSTVDWLKKIFQQGEEQTKEQQGIKSDTNKLRQFNEQEEELRWLKAFSDRQIMSAYNSMTTNNRTINMNGVSQNTMAEAYRRNRSTIPARAAM